MIVRINQFDVARAEEESGWNGRGPGAGLAYEWPEDARAYEVLILDHDEQNRPLAERFRQAQVRQLIPQAVAALREPGEEVVVRLDGLLRDRELLGAFGHLTDADGRGRFAVSEVQKLEEPPREVWGSVRVQPSEALLAGLCGDTDLGLERSVRLRVFSVPERLVNPLLDAGAADDGRWGEILDEAGFVLGTARFLRSLQLITRRFDAAEVKTRLMRRLLAAAHGATR